MIQARFTPLLAERIGGLHRRPYKFVVESLPDCAECLIAALQEFSGLRVLKVIAGHYVKVEAKPEVMEEAAKLPGIHRVSADTLHYIRSPVLGFKLPFCIGTPLPGPLTQIDDFLGPCSVSSVEMPFSSPGGLLTFPIRQLRSLWEKTYTTEQVAEYIGTPADRDVNIKVAVADTGLNYPTLLMRPGMNIHRKSVTLEPAFLGDNMGHGTWVQTTAFGSGAVHPRFGRCGGIAHPQEQLSVKVLSGIGFGTTSQLLEGIAEARDWGARVLNLSLGGPLQGSAIEDDPVCRLVDYYADDMIVVAAAGNDGKDWGIGTPGAARSAITVGSWGITRDGLSEFSSRGPSGGFYQKNPDLWKRDLVKGGSNIIKPDVVVPGGDVHPEEKILSGSAGWFDLLSDPLPGWAGMHGSSMSTPVMSGAVAILVTQEKIKTAQDFKNRMADSWGKPKSSEVGYGLFHFSKFD